MVFLIVPLCVRDGRELCTLQYSYAGALHACLKLADWELSLELLLQMERMGMAANAFSYATAIRTCARCEQSNAAAHMYAQSLRLGVVPNEVSPRVL